MLTQNAQIPVVDLFAGPGGLGEGFSAYGDSDESGRFRVRLSIEMDEMAHRTLQLRSFFRQFARDEVPNEYYLHLRGRLSRSELFEAYPERAEAARREAKLATLGDVAPAEVDDWIRAGLSGADHWVLIGGPPCQAYSVAGRSRNRGVEGYKAEADGRHFLYREYLRIIAEHWPSVFVFENVKGLLSAKVNEDRIFDRILDDLKVPGAAMDLPQAQRRHTYQVWSLSRNGFVHQLIPTAADFIVRAEDYGVPQARHRVFLVGIRDDLAHIEPKPLSKRPEVPVSAVLDGLPPIRSMLSGGIDAPQTWLEAVSQAGTLIAESGGSGGPEVAELIERVLGSLTLPQYGEGGAFVGCSPESDYERDWFVDERLEGVCNHDA